jgi:hypothetical protein
VTTRHRCPRHHASLNAGLVVNSSERALNVEYEYVDTSEENTVGGINNFLAYLDCLEIHRSGVSVWQPPYASGRTATSGPIWRRSVTSHGKKNGYDTRFKFFKILTGTRFHDRFYLTRHLDGSVSGLFGPLMNGLNDKSFVLIGELEALTLKRLLDCLDGWH